MWCCIIDAGAEGESRISNLTGYLKEFFKRRRDLDNTIDSVIVTHLHKDHMFALKEVFDAFTVLNYVDNGKGIYGDAQQVRDEYGDLFDLDSISIFEVTDGMITDLSHRNGFSNWSIDPVNCSGTDPKISVLSGRIDSNPGWSHEEFDNKNNHSIVIRVDFGESSFLFTGDLEEPAILTLVDYYDGTSILDVDVYQVGHHGSKNGTIDGLVNAMTPKIAVISMGVWDDGKPSRPMSAWKYGHPNVEVVDLLSSKIIRNRSSQKVFKVADGAKNFLDKTIKKAIYGTGWSGDIKVTAKSDGSFRVKRQNN